MGMKPTDEPTMKPTMKPTEAPSESPSESPSETPSKSPSRSPTKEPTPCPTCEVCTPKPTLPAAPTKCYYIQANVEGGGPVGKCAPNVCSAGYQCGCPNCPDLVFNKRLFQCDETTGVISYTDNTCSGQLTPSPTGTYWHDQSAPHSVNVKFTCNEYNCADGATDE